jgi:hypothetical protein
MLGELSPATRQMSIGRGEKRAPARRGVASFAHLSRLS